MSDASETEHSPLSAPLPKWPRWLPWPQNLTSAVYGSVLAASVGVGSGDTHGALGLSVILLVTGFVFWVAHVYAETVASVHGGWHMRAIRDGLHEWPLMFASVPPAAAAAAAGVFQDISPGQGSMARADLRSRRATGVGVGRRAKSRPDRLRPGPQSAPQPRNRSDHRCPQTRRSRPLTSAEKIGPAADDEVAMAQTVTAPKRRRISARPE
jgi:hypothetical protein